jgi:hypothetical protein
MSPAEPESAPLRNWEAVEQAITAVTSASPTPFNRETVENARNLANACRERSSTPNGVARGYWTTILIWWGQVEVEVFEDRYELYRFKPGQTDIQHFDHVPGATVPVQLLDQLP